MVYVYRRGRNGRNAHSRTPWFHRGPIPLKGIGVGPRWNHNVREWARNHTLKTVHLPVLSLRQPWVMMHFLLPRQCGWGTIPVPFFPVKFFRVPLGLYWLRLMRGAKNCGTTNSLHHPSLKLVASMIPCWSADTWADCLKHADGLQPKRESCQKSTEKHPSPNSLHDSIPQHVAPMIPPT